MQKCIFYAYFFKVSLKFLASHSVVKWFWKWHFSCQFFYVVNLKWQIKNYKRLSQSRYNRRFLHLYLISEKSSWKDQVWWTGFLVYFELDFYCLCSLQKSISKLILQTENPARWPWVFQLNFSKFKYRSTGKDSFYISR